MPELPEVETVRRGLSDHIISRKIVMTKVNRYDLRFPVPHDLTDQLAEQTITRIDRRSKYILFRLSNHNTLVSHLGMSGKWLHHKNRRNSVHKHDHIEVAFDDGSELIFNDPRRFGLIDLIETSKLSSHKLIRDLGPEPLDKNFTGDVLFSRINNRTIAIKHALMNNRIVVGIGNIYANESLFDAGIHPFTPCNEIDVNAANRLVISIKKTLNAALKSGGSTLRDYVRSSGDVGYFQHQFNVYDRAEQPCKSCGERIIRVKQQGRSTFYCPACQPEMI